MALLLTACATTDVSDQQAYQGPKLPRPGRILVHDYAVAPSDLPEWSKAHGAYQDQAAPMTDEDIARGRKLGAEVARELVEKIEDLGLSAVRAEGEAGPAVDDLILVGYFTTVDEGSTAKRVLIGFGQGAADVGVHAEGYRMTDSGPVLLGQGDVGSEGGKSPGLIVPTVVTIATANPIGLVVGSAVKVAGEATGHSGAEGSAKRIADEIAEVLEKRFQEQGWI